MLPQSFVLADGMVHWFLLGCLDKTRQATDGRKSLFGLTVAEGESIKAAGGTERKPSYLAFNNKLQKGNWKQDGYKPTKPTSLKVPPSATLHLAQKGFIIFPNRATPQRPEHPNT